MIIVGVSTNKHSRIGKTVQKRKKSQKYMYNRHKQISSSGISGQ